MMQFILERANYWAIIGLMMVGLYITFQSTNLIKKLVGLSIFQTSVFLFYVTLGKVAGGSPPILFGRDVQAHGPRHGVYHETGETSEAPMDAASSLLSEQSVNSITGLYETYSNPLPHVLILTAIVVGVATLAVGLALTVRIREAYGTIESDEVRQLDIETADAQDDDDAVEATA